MKPYLILFGEDWGRHPSSTQHLALRLKEHFTIVYINSIGLRAPQFSANDFKRVFDKLLKMFKSKTTQEKMAAPFSVITLPAIPFHAFQWVRNVNAKIWAKKLAVYNTPQTWLWTSLPSALPALNIFNAKQSLYYCGDDFNALAGVDHQDIQMLENELAQKVSFIFVASEKLALKFPFSKTTYLPHGVDYDKFSTPQSRAVDLKNTKKIAGFYGSMSEWLDQDMVVKAAKQLHDWNFVFIGDVHCDISKLTALPNITFLPAKPHSSLPSYVQHFDVALLPFVDNEQIRACNPLKLREYLASGTPIVSSYFPALDPYKHLIEICDQNNLAQKILEAAGNADKKSRQDSVKNESWEARATLILKTLKEVKS